MHTCMGWRVRIMICASSSWPTNFDKLPQTRTRNNCYTTSTRKWFRVDCRQLDYDDNDRVVSFLFLIFGQSLVPSHWQTDICIFFMMTTSCYRCRRINGLQAWRIKNLKLSQSRRRRDCSQKTRSQLEALSCSLPSPWWHWVDILQNHLH